MKCEDVEMKMIDYLENHLDEDDRREIEKHLETCERCLDNIRESQEVINLMAREEMEKPDDSLRINFYHMLHSEIKKHEAEKPAVQTKEFSLLHLISRYKVAAGLALLLCGTLLGILIHSELLRTKYSSELSQLQNEVNSLKKAALFTMLTEESSSNRIQAVNYADEIQNPDASVIDVLVKTLNNDKNVNVRMAAAYALDKFADQQQVCDSLVKSLSAQSDPILQVTLINILVNRKVHSALKPIQQIISSEKTIREVKVVAEKGAKLLI